MARPKKHPWRNAIVSIAVLLPIVAVVVYSSFQVSEYECDVCIEFRGLEACRTVKAKTREEARRGAIDNACALISSGVTDTLACSRTPPRKLECRRIGGGGTG